VTWHEPFRLQRYEATCLACGEAVEPTDAYAWRRAVLSLRCERCGGRMLIDPIDVGGLRSSVQGRITKRTDDRPLRTRIG
jgi:DNA-directed RNA polymerase subunit RPC12/RpoP